MQKQSVDYIILGAGCAGLSLAVELLEANPHVSLALIDARTQYTRDHTWCFWELEKNAWYSPAIQHRWNSWNVMHAGQQQQSTLSQYPYCYINALDYYALAKKKLNLKQVTWLLGTEVQAIDCQTDHVTITTPTVELKAQYLFDSRPPEYDLVKGSTFLLQSFRGWHLQTTQACFDPTHVTLMDFRIAQYNQIHFVYILPFSATEALVEPTFFLNTTQDFPDTIYQQSLHNYLVTHYNLTDYQILHQEQGWLPMVSKTWTRQPFPRYYNIGARAGLLRPSTGYGFCGIQRYNRKLVHKLQNNITPNPPIPYSSSSQWMDQLLLKVLRAAPEHGASLFMQIFKKLPSATIVRFLSDAATYTDIWRMLNAVPKYSFLRKLLLKQ